MKQFLFFLLCAKLFGNTAFSQAKELNTLNAALKTAHTPKAKIDVLNDYADTLCLYRNDTGRVLAIQALQLSYAENYSKGIGEASHSMGLVHFRRNNDSALHYFQQALFYFRKEPPGLEKHLLAINNISRVYNELLQYNSSLEYTKLAVKTVQQSREPELLKKRWLMFSYGAMANTYAGLNKYDSANIYYLNAIRYAELLNNRKMLEVYFKGVSGIQSQIGNYDKAIEYMRKGIAFIDNDERARVIALASLAGIYDKKNDYTNAILIADSSLRLAAKYNIGNSVGINYITLGNSRMAKGLYAEALQLYLTGIQKGKQNQSSRFTMSSLYRKTGEAYEALDSLILAEQMYKQAINVGSGDTELEGMVSLSMSKLLAKKDDYRLAYKNLLDYKHYSDSIFTRESKMVIFDLNTRYETEKKEQALELFAKEKALQQAILKQQQQEIASSYLSRRQQQLLLDNLRLEAEKKEQQLQIQKLDIDNFKIKQREQQAVIAASNSKLELEKRQKEISLNKVKTQRKWLWVLVAGMFAASAIFGLLFNRYKLVKKIEAQKSLFEQRQSISRDLHDEIGATLSGIAMYSHMVKNSLDKNDTGMATQSASIIQESSAEMVNKLNDMVWLIKPQHETMEALIERLKIYTTEICAAKNIQPDIKVSEEASGCTPPLDKRKNIYLICKEAINNAVKYSGATILCIHFAVEEKWLHITIKDDGQGFNSENIKNGNGLTNMQERAAQIGAVLNIDSETGKGCTIALKLKITQ